VSLRIEHLKELKKNLLRWEIYEGISLKGFLTDIDKQNMVMHCMLKTIQSAIDVGDDIIRIKDLEMPSSYKEIFDILERHNLIDKKLSSELVFLAGFRNVLVHLYWKIDLKKVHRVLKTKRIYLKRFYEKTFKSLKL